MSLEDIRTTYGHMGEAFRSCVYCGGNPYTEVEIKFTYGIIEPVIGEILTSITTATGVVASVDLFSGQWCDGTATGYITMTSPTGFDEDGHWGVEGETLSGNRFGTILDLDSDGTEKTYGIFYPESDMIFHDGRWICTWHFRWRYQREEEEKVQIDIEEIQDKY